MKVVIVHYHLRPGGVTRVITNASRVLAAAGIDHVILVGESPDDSAEDLPVRVIEGLAYAASAGSIGEPALTDSLRAAAFDALGGAPDIWHFHNHSLGKNPLMGGLVARLAEDNERLVLQIHDLAEDGRPANYQMIAACPKLYPVSDRIHYAFLNSRDAGIFREAGLPAENTGILVNPVAFGHGARSPGTLPPILFAPVRGIRRKNLGELVFLSAIAPAGARFAVSRAPLNPSALHVHDNWQKFARRQRLPIAFDVVDRFSPAPGAPAGFESWVEHSTHFISTSVAEGFGLTFLEAIARRKPLIGRNLTHIAAELARHGIVAENLYDRILVPAEWIDLVILREHLTTTLERNHRAYGRPLLNETITAAFDGLVHDGWLDFGNLTEPLQQGVIERLADSACRRIPTLQFGGRFEVAEQWLAAAIADRTPAADPEQLAPYSPAAYGTAIGALYSDLTNRPASAVSFLPGAEVLTTCLVPGSFHFLLSALKPAPPPRPRHRAVVFDIYGTLLIAPAGGARPDPAADGMLRKILQQFGHEAPDSPSTALHEAVRRHHAAAGVPFPEVDLRVLWREVLSLGPDADLGPLVEEIEAAWHPSRPMPGAAETVRRLSRSGISLGLLSNAQCNTLGQLGGIADLFAPELTILSYQHGIAKPSAGLFAMMADRLAGRGIAPEETLFIGNDPAQDIAPAAAHGFKTALFTGHPDSIREGVCTPDFEIRRWSDLTDSGSSEMHGEW
jgi:FMN phosphatase YigB (HAD superfamily)/glycosyltransferase involved in cell wall biosynthesis